MRAFLLLALVLGLAGGCRDASPDLAGTWVGEGRQYDDGVEDGDPDGRWIVRVSLEADPTAGGSVEYPDLKCGGSLAYVEASPEAERGDLLFRERLSYGTDNCADDGTVRLRPSGGAVSYTWSADGGAAEATARLERE